MRKLFVLKLSLLFAAVLHAATCTPASYLINTTSWKTNDVVVIPEGSGASDPDHNGAVGASVFVDSGGTIYAYYVGYNTAASSEKILYASGPDVSHLTKQGVALSAGSGGQWDSGYVSGDRVFQDIDCSFYLYYFGSQSTMFEGTPASIGVATSSVITGPWTKYSGNPILSPGMSGAWDDTILYRPFVLLNGGTYYLFYNAKGTEEQTGYATAASPLGPWTKYSGNPVLSPSAGQWDSGVVGDPFVFGQSSPYTLIYRGSNSGFTEMGVGLATSSDLSTWTKQTTASPIPIAGDPNSGTSTALDRAALANINSHSYAFVDNGSAIYVADANPPQPDPPSGLPTYVQSNVANYAASTTTACAYSTNVTVGDLLVSFGQANSNLSMTIADTQSVSWSQIFNWQPPGANTSTTNLWYGIANSTGPETITITSNNGSQLLGSVCLEYSGVSSLDQHSITNQGTGTTSTTPSITTVHGSELLLALFRVDGTSGPGVTINSPFTQRQSITLAGSAYAGIGDNIVGAIGTYSSSATVSNNAIANVGAAGIASFYGLGSSTQMGVFLPGP